MSEYFGTTGALEGPSCDNLVVREIEESYNIEWSRRSYRWLWTPYSAIDFVQCER